MTDHRSLLASFACSLVVLSACDDKPAPTSKDTTPSAQPSASAAPAPDTTSAVMKPALSIFVEDKRLTINSDKVDLTVADPKPQVTSALAGKAGIEGAVVDVIVTREALTPKVALVVGALRAAKAQGVNVKTTRRDGSTTSVALTWGVAHPDCAAVAMIGKDNSISTWSAGGGTATRFAHGFAGPDLTLGSAGVRKIIQGCDATVFYLSAADNITWGLAFDLALAIRGGEDGGAPAKSINTTLLLDPPVPGRKVAQD